MKFFSVFTSAIALMAAGASASAVVPKQILDVCAFVNADLTAVVAGVTKDFGLVDLCLCVSALPLFITTNLAAIAAVEALGVAAVLADLKALINAAPPCVPTVSSKVKRDSYILDDHVCPKGLTLCGVQSSWSRTAWECINTQSDLESCGGCSVGILGTGATGTDCTAIDGVDEVSCRAGQCQVLSCARGYEVSTCGTMCVRKH